MYDFFLLVHLEFTCCMGMFFCVFRSCTHVHPIPAATLTKLSGQMGVAMGKPLFFFKLLLLLLFSVHVFFFFFFFLLLFGMSGMRAVENIFVFYR